MRDLGVPIIKIEVETMRLGILRALSEHNVATSEAVSKAIESFPWEETIRKQVHDAIEETLKRAVGDAAWRLREAISEKVATQINRTLDKVVGKAKR